MILDKTVASRRNDFLKKLKEAGVGCSVYYPQPVPRMRYYQEKYNCIAADYRNASILSDNAIALPVGPHLCEEDMLIIAREIKHILSVKSLSEAGKVLEMA